MKYLLPAVSVLSVLSSAALAQSARVVLLEGDPVPGVGDVQEVLTVGISDAKTLLTLTSTSEPDPNREDCLLCDGVVVLREGQPLDSRPGFLLDEIYSVDLDTRGNVASVIQLRDGSRTLSGLALNEHIIALEGDPYSSALAPAGAYLDVIEFAKLADGALLVQARVRVPARREVMLLFKLDGHGQVASRTELSSRFSVLSELGGALVASFANSRTAFDVNSASKVIGTALTTAGTTVLLDMQTPLAVTGRTSPVSGRKWRDLNSAKVSLNDRDEYVIAGILDGDVLTDYVITKNGAKFVQEGDVLTELSALPLGNGSAAPVHLANSGDVFWRASLQGSSDVALMRNLSPVLRTGQVVGRDVIAAIDADQYAFDVSPDGRYLAAHVELDGGREAVVFVDLGLVLRLDGCHGNPGTLFSSNGAACAGAKLELAMDDGHVPGALARIRFSTRPRVPGSACGVVNPFGEWLISPAHIVGSLFLPPWDGANPTSVRVTIPANPSLVNRVFFAQGSFRRPGSTSDIVLTNALRIEIGAL